MKRALIALTLAWYVTTYSGQLVAGPFTLINDCQEVAEYMAKRSWNVSPTCVSR